MIVRGKRPANTQEDARDIILDRVTDRKSDCQPEDAGGTKDRSQQRCRSQDPHRNDQPKNNERKPNHLLGEALHEGIGCDLRKEPRGPGYQVPKDPEAEKDDQGEQQ